MDGIHDVSPYLVRCLIWSVQSMINTCLLTDEADLLVRDPFRGRAQIELIVT